MLIKTFLLALRTRDHGGAVGVTEFKNYVTCKVLILSAKAAINKVIYNEIQNCVRG